MSQNKRYQANPVVSCGDEVDGAVLYNPDSDNTTIVNLTGRDLWSFLQTPQTPDEIVAHLVGKYRGVTVEQASEDVELFIETLMPDFLQEITHDN